MFRPAPVEARMKEAAQAVIKLQKKLMTNCFFFLNQVKFKPTYCMFSPIHKIKQLVLFTHTEPHTHMRARTHAHMYMHMFTYIDTAQIQNSLAPNLHTRFTLPFLLYVHTHTYNIHKKHVQVYVKMAVYLIISPVISLPINMHALINIFLTLNMIFE